MRTSGIVAACEKSVNDCAFAYDLASTLRVFSADTTWNIDGSATIVIKGTKFASDLSKTHITVGGNECAASAWTPLATDFYAGVAVNASDPLTGPYQVECVLPAGGTAGIQPVRVSVEDSGVALSEQFVTVPLLFDQVQVRIRR